MRPGKQLLRWVRMPSSWTTPRNPSADGREVDLVSLRFPAQGGVTLLLVAAIFSALPPLVAAEDNTAGVSSASETVAAEPDAPAPASDFSAFRVLTERNIFDPNRRARSRQTPREPEPEKPPRVDVISLTGVMSYGERELAFFDSNANEFRRMVKPGESLAGYTLRRVGQDRVALEGAGATIELRIGQQLRREEDGGWEVTSGLAIGTPAGSNSRRESSPGQNPGPSADDETAGGPATDAADDASEVLKRLMERRRKETEQ